MKNKCYRIHDGALWLWESDGEYLREIKICELVGKPTINNFAESFITHIKKNTKKIIINLK